jgi:hypothetical protein
MNKMDDKNNILLLPTTKARELEIFIESENLRVALEVSGKLKTNTTNNNNNNNESSNNDTNNEQQQPDNNNIQQLITTTTNTDVITTNNNSNDENNNDILIHSCLPNDLILRNIIAPFIDDDTLHLTLPRLNKFWYQTITNNHTSLLWKRLFETRVINQWLEHGLLSQAMAIQTNSTIVDFERPFYRRKWVRASGPYYHVQLRWKTTVRNMWTPRDIPTVQVTYHFRILWFLSGQRCLYISTPCTDPDGLFNTMKKIISFSHQGDHNNNNNNHVTSNNSNCVRVGDREFYWGSWQLQREQQTNNNIINITVTIPLRRYGVMYTFLCGAGGRRIEWTSLRTFTHDERDAMWHVLPNRESNEDLEWGYRPSVSHPLIVVPTTNNNNSSTLEEDS